MCYYLITDLGTGRLVGGFSGDNPKEAFDAMIESGVVAGEFDDYLIEPDEPLFRVWFNDTPTDEQTLFYLHEAEEYGRRFGFDPSLVKPGCDIPFYDDEGLVVGGVVEENPASGR